jgi:uncharacterized phage protein gp47/JayE
MIARVATRAGVTDFEESSVVKQILAAVAREIDDSNYQLTRLQDLFSIDRAAGDDLDRRAAEILPVGLRRIQAQRAVGYVVFSRSSNTGTTISIPAGTELRTTTGVTVRTIQRGVISGTSPEQISGHGIGRDSTPVAAIATTSGTIGNIELNTATQFSSRPPGISSATNVATFVRGRDAESDAAFRTRIKQYVSSLSSCTVDALKYAALGQTTASGRQVAYAHVAEDINNPGNVTLYIDDGTGAVEETVTVAASGSGASISAPVAGVQTFSAPSGPFLAEHVGRSVTVAGTGNVANHGTFTILAVNGSTQITYSNPTGVVEAYAAGITFALGNEELVASAVGGEEYVSTTHAPIRLSSPISFTTDVVGKVFVIGSNVFLNPANGLVRFNPSLVPTETVTTNYTYYTGLIALVQKVIDGDPNDRENFPGIRPAGVLVRVAAPTTVPITVRARLTLERGRSFQTVSSQVESSILAYVNDQGISGDIVRNEIIERIMSVDGVTDCILEIPSANITINDNELARITANDIDIL